MSLRVLLVDDEAPARGRLRQLLSERSDVEIVGEAEDGVEAIERIQDVAPDVIFLDIQMPGFSGLDVAASLGPARPAIIFCTAFDQHAIEAFEVNAVDYLLKPVDAARLEQALARAKRRLSSDRGGDPVNDQLERIVKMMANRQIWRDQVAVKAGDRFLLVQAEEIIYASLADESINIVTRQVAGTSNYRTLDELQARLDPEVFWRVHRSHLVNINKIKEIVPWFSRNYILRMKDAKGTEIPVSRSQTKRLREYLKL